MTRVVLVDDEAPARRRLRRLCDELGDVEIVGEAAGGLEAIEVVAAASPDVVLLDIQMPEVDGFAVAAALAGVDAPAVVFVTAHDAHAVRAFEVHAVDYLVKPVAAPRLRAALARAETWRAAAAASLAATSTLAATLAQLRAAVAPRRYLDKVFVEDRARLIPVWFAEVERVVAEDNYVRIHLPTRELLYRTTISALAAVLDPAELCRVSRSTIVRLRTIRELRPLGHGDLEAVLASGATVRCSRRYPIPGHGPAREP